MMGIHEEQKNLFSYHVDLDRRVRADNPLRAIREQVDFSWVRDEVADSYGSKGNVSVDPQIIVKLLFLLFYDNVKSERELMRIVPERLDYLWFLGLNLDDPVPDHSVLSKARARWGREVFEQLFMRTVSQCVRAGLVGGEKLHADSSLIDADASGGHNLLNGSAELIAALREAYEVQEKKLYQPQRRSSYQPKYKRVLSKTDPDATLDSRQRSPARPRYKSHRAVDDKKGVITATEVTAASVHDGACLPGLIGQHERHSGQRVQTVVGDSHYGTRHNFLMLQAQGKRTHMGICRSRGQARAQGIFPHSAFIYERKTDTFICPAGERLICRGFNKNENGWYYRAASWICECCKLQEQCYRSSREGYTRMLLRFEGHELIEEGHRQAQSAAAQRDRRRRQTLIEGSFGQAAQNHGFKRARWRRLWRQQIQDYLIASIQNIKLLIRHAPQRSSVANCMPSASFLSFFSRIGRPKPLLKPVNAFEGARSLVLHPATLSRTQAH